MTEIDLIREEIVLLAEQVANGVVDAQTMAQVRACLLLFVFARLFSCPRPSHALAVQIFDFCVDFILAIVMLLPRLNEF